MYIRHSLLTLKKHKTQKRKRSINTYAKSTLYLFKEYLINVASDSLTLNFAPTGNSLAFINAVEVVSVPDELLSNQPVTLPAISSFVGLSGYALETAYRINVGGTLVTPINDTLGRTWVPDQSYLTSSGTAKSVSVLAAALSTPQQSLQRLPLTLSMPQQMRWQMQM